MAGLGETCTHIAAIRFYLEAQYLRIKDINFTSAKSRIRNLDEMLITGSSNNSVASENEPDTTANSPKESEMEAFYKELSQAGTKPAILPLVPKHSEAYVSSTSTSNLPPSLETLFDFKYQRLDYCELLVPEVRLL